MLIITHKNKFGGGRETARLVLDARECRPTRRYAATILETDRTSAILSALREHLRDANHDDLKQEIADAYYDNGISFDELKPVAGHEEAANFCVLKGQLDEEFVDTTPDDLADS